MIALTNRLSHFSQKKMTDLASLMASRYSSIPHVVQTVDYATKGTSMDAQSLFHQPHRHLFTGWVKDSFVDSDSEWCYLCQEPLGVSSGTHVGERDHTNLQLFLYLNAIYPRTWNAKNLLNHMRQSMPSLHRYATTALTTNHLHTQDDFERRQELEALIRHLARPPHQALTAVLQGVAPLSVWYSGERMWKAAVTRACVELFPPMAAGIMTNFTQKCWSRTNEERLYDALHIASIQREFGREVDIKTSKDARAFYMRALLWELLSVVTKDNLDEVTRLLVQIALQRMCFEQIFLCSMIYMNRVHKIVEELEYPSLATLHKWRLDE